MEHTYFNHTCLGDDMSHLNIPSYKFVSWLVTMVTDHGNHGYLILQVKNCTFIFDKISKVEWKLIVFIPSSFSVFNVLSESVFKNLGTWILLKWLCLKVVENFWLIFMSNEGCGFIFKLFWNKLSCPKHNFIFQGSLVDNTLIQHI